MARFIGTRSTRQVKDFARSERGSRMRVMAASVIVEDPLRESMRDFARAAATLSTQPITPSTQPPPDSSHDNDSLDEQVQSPRRAMINGKKRNNDEDNEQDEKSGCDDNETNSNTY